MILLERPERARWVKADHRMPAPGLKSGPSRVMCPLRNPAMMRVRYGPAGEGEFVEVAKADDALTGQNIGWSRQARQESAVDRPTLQRNA
jgi:hypothetical protein